jgi:hypothetical protein
MAEFLHGLFAFYALLQQAEAEQERRAIGELFQYHYITQIDACQGPGVLD